MFYSIDLTVAWALLLAFSVFVYVVLDGFDLGIGILYPFFREKSDRDIMMNSVAPVWDGNETWLVLGGGGLFAAFPLAYAVIMPAVYPAIIAMLLALIFRGVAFEYRWRASSRLSKRAWDAAFIGGSVTAALAQGIILGAFLQGIEVEGRAYAGGWWDWLTPFSILCGVSVVVGYAFLGACWLNMKLEGEIQHRVRVMARAFFVATIVGIVAVSLATPFLGAGYAARWFGWPQIALTAPVPILIGGIALLLLRSLFHPTRDRLPFILGLVLFALCFLGLGISIWPLAIPQEITIWEAAAPAKSQLFMFVGAIVLVPIILAYTGYAYWVFRGKLDPEKGYH
ncbi:cytochrome bd-I ubiquinol oxidase subunit 2 apoprotein [Limimaricola soesokkakensis]|uniref:Cytochrome bd-I ubiquinol oxidase subunit 2 n=1 Tax=Limimaricola soesokkakensis TaxID=1343159 RepID=A0A1X6YEN2_9RHOB|nr:cytochrome d ubiquinol oxidase subunit II [Limimaricola soesokkakensis]PSK82184.1 cytochrome bd-I ubiquinol oxidase subunit 2 apoprotein [Limimaricola soesokkakensis]SLN19117.1 Cytochrome bd-I ubiquinol oxidase subunit 2 [Limimaricola soesokkakensis]